MLMKISIIMIVAISCVVSQTPSCSYVIHSTYGYTCNLFMINPHGYDNFTSINGSHLVGHTDENVKRVIPMTGLVSQNIPSIICSQFPNIVRFELTNIGVQTIGENSFKYCSFIEYLNLNLNNIIEIHEDAFVENVRMTSIYLNTNQLSALPRGLFRLQFYLTRLELQRNQIEDLPNGIFNSLTRLTILYLDNNSLSIFHSNSFGLLPNLATFYFSNNNMQAFDERIVNNTGMRAIDTSYNLCSNINGTFTDNTANRGLIRVTLSRCFENFLESDGVITTTDANQCGVGNIDNRVCQLEDEKQVMRVEINDLTTRLKILEEKMHGLTTASYDF